jgi:hypothetical protein
MKRKMWIVGGEWVTRKEYEEQNTNNIKNNINNIKTQARIKEHK